MRLCSLRSLNRKREKPGRRNYFRTSIDALGSLCDGNASSSCLGLSQLPGLGPKQTESCRTDQYALPNETQRSGTQPHAEVA